MPRNYPTTFAAGLTVLFPVWIVMGNAVQDIAMSMIAVLFLLHSALQKDWRWAEEPWVRCLMLLWCYMIARGAVADYHLYATDSAGFAANSYEALRRALPFGRYFVFAAALGFWTLRDSTSRERFFNVLALVLLLLAADCMLQWFSGHDIIGRPILQDPGSHLRLTGPFRAPMPGVLLAWLYFPACLPLLLDGQGALKRGADLLKGAALSLFIIAAIAFSGERVALLFTLAGWLLAILLLPNKKVLLGVFACGIVLLGAVAFLSPMVMNRQGASTLHALQDWQHSPYGQLLATDLRLAAQHPVFGGGTNYFRLDCPALYPGYDKQALAGVCNTHPHNIYLEWLIDNGAIGLGLFIAFLALAARKFAGYWRDARVNPCFTGCLIAFLMRIWPLASSTDFFSPFGAPPFWLVFGVLMVWERKEERSSI